MGSGYVVQPPRLDGLSLILDSNDGERQLDWIIRQVDVVGGGETISFFFACFFASSLCLGRVKSSSHTRDTRYPALLLLRGAAVFTVRGAIILIRLLTVCHFLRIHNSHFLRLGPGPGPPGEMAEQDGPSARQEMATGRATMNIKQILWKEGWTLKTGLSSLGEH